MSPVIEVKHLTKDFKEVKAVNDLSFTVNPGEVYGFLGQNGAGKSTTIRMLLTLITPTSGIIELFGLNIQQHRKEILRQVGAIIEKPDFYKYLSAIENLRLFARMSGVVISERKLMDQLAMVGLAGRADSKVKTYSQGMKQRLGIATALVHDPQLIILDEPTNGLDPQGIADIRKLIIQLSKEMNKTILVSSHLLSEVELIADSMIIIDKGKKLAEGKVTELFDPAETVVELTTTDNDSALSKLKLSAVKNSIIGVKEGNIQLKLNKQLAPQVLKDIMALNIDVISFHTRHSLEDYFLSLTTGSADVAAS